MHRAKHHARRIPRAVSTLIASMAALAWVALGRVGMVLAQVKAPDSEIPENAPTNWSIQFVGEPLVLVAILLAVVCAIAYAWRMIRLRYPRSS